MAGASRLALAMARAALVASIAGEKREREEEKREDEERLCTGSCLGQSCKWSGMTELRRLL
jgi:hypothetical protein